MNTVVKYFVRGIVIVVPIGLTVWVVYKTFTFVDRWLTRLVEVPFPGLGFVITLAGITLVGALASNFVGRRVVRLTISGSTS